MNMTVRALGGTMGDKFQADAVTRRALELMHKGFHCGPAVMTVCQETFKWPEKQVLKFMVVTRLLYS